jgi:hypothetical protein
MPGSDERKKFESLLKIDQFYCKFLMNFAQISNFKQEKHIAYDLDVLKIQLPPFKKKELPRIVGRRPISTYLPQPP